MHDSNSRGSFEYEDFDIDSNEGYEHGGDCEQEEELLKAHCGYTIVTFNDHHRSSV
jgi:hypothetical protein